MSSEARVRKRKPVRHKQMRDVERQLAESMGLEVDMSSAFIELAPVSYTHLTLPTIVSG